MAFVTLDDRTGRLEVAVFADTYNANREKLVKDALLVIEGQISHDDYNGGLKMRADTVTDLAEARQARVAGIRINWRNEKLPLDFAQQLRRVLEPYRQGNCRLAVRYQRADVAGDIFFGQDWQVNPTDELLQNLRGLYGAEQVELLYH